MKLYVQADIELLRFCAMPSKLGNQLAKYNGRDSAADLGNKLSDLTTEDGLLWRKFVPHCVKCNK